MWALITDQWLNWRGCKNKQTKKTAKQNRSTLTFNQSPSISFTKNTSQAQETKKHAHYHGWVNHQPIQVSSQAWWFIMLGAIYQHTGLWSELWTNRCTRCKMVLNAKSSAWMCLHYYHLFDCCKQVYTIYRVLYSLQDLFISIISFDPHSSRNHDSLSPDEKMGSNEAQRGFLVSARSHS